MEPIESAAARIVAPVRRPHAPKVFALLPPKSRGNVRKAYAAFEPEAIKAARNAFRDDRVRAPFPTPAGDLADLTADQKYLARIQSLLSPDNFQLPFKFVTSQVAVGIAYDYAIPKWCRHALLTNRSTNPSGGTNSGNLYYWYDNSQQGAKQLPQNYFTLTAGQSLSENMDYTWLTLYADTTMTDQGWEIRFSGRPTDDGIEHPKTKGLRAPHPRVKGVTA
jgi:hypothetical protein